MRPLDRASAPLLLFVACACALPRSATAQAARPDLLTFARGAIPVAFTGEDAHRTDMTHAVRIVDGQAGGFTVASRADADTEVSFTYALPAPTTFERLAVPNVLETPSPSQTFFQRVVVEGSAVGVDGPFVTLGTAELDTHAAPGQETELELAGGAAVRWIRVRLAGGIEMSDGPMFLEFSEIIGEGQQDVPALEEGFGRTWRGRGVALSLEQEGSAVRGCYDRGSPLSGTVSGNLLTAIGVGAGDGVVSHFIAAVTGEEMLRGLRSTNGAPFRLFEGVADPSRPVDCSEPAPEAIGCGAVLHGIRFAFDSAEILPESAPTLQRLADGLRSGDLGNVVIEGHTSSEGAEAYNQALSERRAAAVRDALIELGIEPSRLDSAGRGESVPIARNDDEAGRAMNRRVEIRCASEPSA